MDVEASSPRSTGPMEVEPDPPQMPPQSDGMDLDAMVDEVIEQSLEQEEDSFLRRMFRKARGPGQILWCKVKCLGKVIWQSFQQGERCENTGKVMDAKQLESGIKKEFEQLEKLEVGDFVSEDEAHALSKKSGVKILTSRWVHVQKTPELVRSRLVVCDFRSTGLSSLREHLYSPTTSIVGLRIALALAQYFGWWIFTLDVSTAFLFATLLESERQVICLPASAQGEDGGKAYLYLRKALYGLRRAPFAWFRTISAFLKEIGGEATSISTVFRYQYEGQMALVLVYVDDLCITGSHDLCRWIIERLQERYQIKETGMIEPQKKGSLEYLGRQIIRFRNQGPLTLGLPETYFDSVEATLEMNLKPVQSPPKLERFADVKEDMELSEKEAKVFRAALGRLAWIAVSLPVIQFQTNFVACFQAKPTQAGMAALKDAVRYTKRYRGYRQEFGTSVWGEGVSKVTAVVDASWSTRSVAGGVVFVASSAIASFSRRIQTTCLSSAEAELHAMVEVTNEGISAAFMVDQGLPGRKMDGNYDRVTGVLPIWLHTDSESAKCVAAMTGLLRKLRHLELRLQYLQELTESQRLIVEFIRGSENFSDVLTKSSDKTHVELFLEATGLTFFEALESLKALSEEKSVCDASEISEKPKVSFSSEVQVHEVDEELLVYRAIPERWRNVLRKNPLLSEWRTEISKWVRGYVPLVVEICCSENSGMCQAAKKLQVPYLGITSEIGFSNDVKSLLRMILEYKLVACFHISSPCTAGCNLRHLQLERSEKHLQTWKERIEEHRKIWSHLEQIFQRKETKSTKCITQEWPKGNSLFQDALYLRVSKEINLIHECEVNRCCIDGVKKHWIVRTNQESMTGLLSTGVFNCGPTETAERLADSGYYSFQVGTHIVKAMKAWTRALLKEGKTG